MCYKMLMKDITDLNKWRDIPCARITRLNTIKMSLLSKLVHRFNAIPTKIPASLFIAINKIIPKFIRKGKGTKIPKAVVNKSKCKGPNKHMKRCLTS